MKPKPDEDETALFREATRDVKPLALPARAAGDPPKPRARARFARAERRAVLEEILHGSADEPDLVAADPTQFARPGVPESTLRRLRRGQYRVQAELDLHGLTQAQARVQLGEFLLAALQRDARCLRIVHGKGLRSGVRGPVLKHVVGGILKRTGPVLAVVTAPRTDGGSGAVYVLLSPP